MAFSCDRCDKTFTARYLLNRHLVAHTGVRNHLCSVCGEAFLQSSALNRHAAIHESRLAYSCEECGKRFNRSSTRDVHQASHAEKKHACKRCGKAFHQKSTLKTHELIHTETRPFRCCYCEETFRQRSNLQVHISRRHKGVTKTLRNDDSGFGRKKEVDLLCSHKFGQDIRRENCTNGCKHRYKEKTYPFDSVTSQLCDVDIVGEVNMKSCSKVMHDISNDNKDEAKISDLCQSRTSLPSNNSLETFENPRKNRRNSTVVATKTKLCSDSEVEDECENEEYPSLVHSMSPKFKSNNSEVCPNTGEKSDFEPPSRPAPSSIDYCKDINDREAIHRPKDTNNSAAARKVANLISSISGNTDKVDVASNTAAIMEFGYSFPAQNNSSPSAVHSKLVEANGIARDSGNIAAVSDALPISLSVLPQSNINIHTNPLSIHANPSPIHTDPSPIHTNPSPIHTNPSPIHTDPALIHTNSSPVSKQDESSFSVLPNMENFLANVFESCRLATSLMNSPITSEPRTTNPRNQKLAPGSCNFAGNRTTGDKHDRLNGSTSKKSEKLMYVKLFTPEKPVTEFVWSCGGSK